MSGFQTFPFAPVRNAVSHLFVDVGARLAKRVSTHLLSG